MLALWACTPKAPLLGAVPAPDGEGVASAAVLVGREPGFALSVEVVGDTDGDGYPELYIAQSASEATSDSGGDLLVAHPLTGGSTEALVIARLPPGHGEREIANAGDTDGDGTDDLWLGQRLFRGPLAGPYGLEEADAHFESFLGRAVVGDFDADSDGVVDVAFGGRHQELVVEYGPFDGALVGYDGSDKSLLSGVTLTASGEDCGQERVSVLGEGERPGSLVLVAGSGTMPFCSGALRAYDVAGPRGRSLGFDDAIARWNASELEPLPDADGDGHIDVLYLQQPLVGPPHGSYPSATDERFPPVLRFVDAQEVHAISDVTGDGLGDLLVQVHPASESAPAWYVVPGTTRGLDLDIRAHGVRLAVSDAPQWTWGDLDLDGLAEVIASAASSDERESKHRWVQIFIGADIAQAFRTVAEERQ